MTENKQWIGSFPEIYFHQTPRFTIQTWYVPTLSIPSIIEVVQFDVGIISRSRDGDRIYHNIIEVRLSNGMCVSWGNQFHSPTNKSELFAICGESHSSTGGAFKRDLYL